MPGRLDALQTMISVSFRRFPRGLHSVAKQASFSVAFGSDLGGFWEANMEAKLEFWEAFLKLFFECDFGVDFWWFFGCSNHEK